jgi:hypothetical protein
MSCVHRRQAEALLLVLAGLFLCATTLVVAGCGSQSGGNQNAKYEGTWVQATSAQGDTEIPIIVKKAGNKYTFTTVPSVQSTGAFGYGTSTTDTGGAVIIHCDSTASGKTTLYAMPLGGGAEATTDGGKLKLPLGDKTAEIAVSGDTMTVVVSGVEGVFTFSRATASPSP